MDLRPVDQNTGKPIYEDFSRFLINKVKFGGTTAIVNTALNITEGFMLLHRLGLSYQDLNDGNFFINPQNGDVLICDNDNVSPYGKSSGIAGKARYMAPEVVLGKKLPDIMTDRFSLAVVLFRILCGDHPLEGKNYYSQPCITPKWERYYYGENPIFLFDLTDASNEPVPGLTRAAIHKWLFLPPYLQKVFIETFSKEAMTADPGKRVKEQDWLWTFIRLRGEIIRCSCGTPYFADPVNPNPCPDCKKITTFDMYLKTGRYNIPVHGLTRLYSCHTEKDSDDFRTLTGKMSAIAGGGFALGNTSQKKWSVEVDGTVSSVEPNKAIILIKGMAINFGGGTAEII
jgi:serine/threonine protein kinase